MDIPVNTFTTNSKYGVIAYVVYGIRMFVPLNMFITKKDWIEQVAPSLGVTASCGVIILTALGIISWIKNNKRYNTWAKRGYRKDERDRYSQ